MPTKLTPTGELNYDTKRNRIKKGIPLGLRLNYHHKWKARVPKLIEMIEHGMTVELIAQYYACAPTSISYALEGEGMSVSYIKRAFRNNYIKGLGTPEDN